LDALHEGATTDPNWAIEFSITLNYYCTDTHKHTKHSHAYKRRLLYAQVIQA